MFAKSGVEAQLDAMFSNQVTLNSGGYIVINQTEALVAIDVNSGRSTREHNIEDTALRTNLEAADEIARQLRLRDLAGLIVIDFIDMEEGAQQSRGRAAHEGRAEERPRAHPGRPHLAFRPARNVAPAHPHRRARRLDGDLPALRRAPAWCARPSSIALHVLRVARRRADQERQPRHDGARRARAVALYILNQKRAHLRDLERRFGVAITIEADDSLTGDVYHALERGEPASGGHEPLALAAAEPQRIAADEFADEAAVKSAEVEDVDIIGGPIPVETGRDEESGDEGAERREGESESEADSRRRRRRRRRRGRGGDREGSGIAANAPQPPDDALEVMARIGQFQPVIATAQPPVEGSPEADFAFGGDVEAQAAHVPARLEADSVEDVIEASPLPIEEPVEEAAPKPAERRRQRRGAKAREAQEDAPGIAAQSDAEKAPELALEGNAPEVDGEAAAPRRSRRPPRPRAPRRAIAAEAEAAAPETEAAPAEAEVTQAETASAPLFAHAPEADAPADERGAAPIASTEPIGNREPVGEGAQAESQSPPQHEDPARPKRSGWWQRAKASLGR